MEEADATSLKLCELLRHAEDLEKLPALKADFARRKGQVDAQLKAGLQSQLEVTGIGVSAIKNGHKTLNGIKEEMMRIDKLCAEAESMIQEFPLINKISKIHRNFVSVEDIISSLQELTTRINALDQMLQDDSGDEYTNPMPNLLPIHFALTQLQDFQENVMSQSDKADNDIRATLEGFWPPLENVVDAFDERIGLIAMNLVDIVRAGNPSLVVRLAKIVEAEERSDERALALKEAQDAHQHLAARFKSIKKGVKAPRGYKDKFLTCISAAVQAKFDDTRAKFESDPETLSESLHWYFDDLRTVRHEFPSLFPPKWDIFRVYLDIYHSLMHDFLKSFIDREDLDGQSLLTIILWNGEYTKGLKSLGLKPADLTPHVIDGKEAELLHEYTQLIAKKMEEWTNNIIEEDTKEFTMRTHQPNEEEGKWHMPSVPTMFTMIRQQLDVALGSNKGNVVSGVVDECVRLLKRRQSIWERVLQDEIGRHIRAVTREEQEALPDGILEYMMAVANDQIRCAAYTQEISDSVAPLLSKKYEDAIRASLEEAMNGFVDVATFVLSQIIDIIFNDLKPVTKVLFATSWYANGNEMDTIVSTIRSYVVDLQPGLDDDLFPAFMQQLSERMCVTYLLGVHNKGAKLRSAEAPNQIRQDVQTGYGFLVEYMERDEVRDVWKVLEQFLSLICAEKDQLPAVCSGFKEAYWDLPMSWVEAVLKCREDKSRDMIESVKVGMPYTPRGMEPTLASRLS